MCAVDAVDADVDADVDAAVDVLLQTALRLLGPAARSPLHIISLSNNSNILEINKPPETIHSTPHRMASPK